MFWAWVVFQHTDDRREKRTIRQLQRQYEPIIRGYAAKRARNRHCRGMARNLSKLWPALWSFANHSGVQPTNNHAERSLGVPSSTASSPSELNPRLANDGPSGCSQPRSPAAYNTARCSPT